MDLPTQQELLAQFRCDEIATVALAEFNEQAKSQKRPIELGRVVEGLGGMMKQWKSAVLCESFYLQWCRLYLTYMKARYDREASRYHKDVYSRKRTDLLAVVDSVLSPLFLGQLKNLHKACLVAFKKEMLEGLRGENSNFADVVTAAKDKCEVSFAGVAKEAKLEDTDWVWEDELELLREEVKAVSDQCRADETKKMVNQIEVRIRIRSAVFPQTYSTSSAPSTAELQEANFRPCRGAPQCSIGTYVGRSPRCLSADARQIRGFVSFQSPKYVAC